jgi:microcompartment protein CcmK/EutM
MRIARVIGKLTMSRTLPDIVPGSYLLVRPCGRKALVGQAESAEELVFFDDLGAREDDLCGMVEGLEATRPFLPRKVPFDSYNACILDEVNFRPVLPVK